MAQRIKNSQEFSGKILSYLEEVSPILPRVIEAALYFRENKPQFHEGMENLNLYEVYSLIRLKILDVFKKFFNAGDPDDGTEEILFELGHNCKTEEDRERLMSRLFELNEKMHDLIKNNTTYFSRRSILECYFYVDLDMSDPAYAYLSAEICRAVLDFLVHFDGKFSYETHDFEFYFGIVEVDERRRAKNLEAMLDFQQKCKSKSHVKEDVETCTGGV